MRKGIAVLGVAAAAVLLATSAFAANRGVKFTSIGFIDPSAPFASSSIYSMNPQGTVFMASPYYFGNYCFEWTYENGWGTEVGQAGSVCDISANGTIMASGIYPGSDPAYFSAGTWAGAPNVWDPIPFPSDYAPCDQPGISFYGMGGDGDYATGLTWSGCSVARPFRWDKATNTTVTLASINDESARGNAISNDGATVVGWNQMLFGTWRGAEWDNGVGSFIDGQGNVEPMTCAGSGKPCTYNGGDPVYGCPGEYVDDAHCDLASCTGNVCVGGPNAGSSCTYSWDCAGYCVGGPNAGDTCTGDYYCPDTQVCVNNPAWSDAAYKGEARDIADDGTVVGVNFGYDYPAWNSAYLKHADGSFTEIPTSPTFPDVWQPLQISADGKTVVGYIGNPFFGQIAAFWNQGTGTQDLQLFLVEQGLDELFFWPLLAQVNAVNADGTVIAGAGYNPDYMQEGFVVDMKKLWVCHVPPGHPENARTLGISFADVGDHLAHGDFLGTCEFLNSGGLSRAATLRDARNHGYSPVPSATKNPAKPTQNPFFNPKAPVSWDYSRLGRPVPPAVSDPSVSVRPTSGTSAQKSRINDVRDRILSKTRNTND